MILWLNEKLNGDDEGFTLIELMVVVLIIAILIAIAIPTFLGARRRAQDRQAQSNLRNGLTAEKTYYADVQAYTNDTTALGDIESNLNWTTADAAARGLVVQEAAAGTPAGQTVILRSLSKSGTLFCIADVAQDLSVSGGVSVDAGTYYVKVANASLTTTCTGTWQVTTALGW